MMAGRAGRLILALIAAVLAPPLLADDHERPVLTISVEQVLSRSEYGRALSREINARFGALVEENRRIETELEAEELALVEQRRVLSDEEFRPIAEEFDRRVRRIRAEQQAKLEAIEGLRSGALEPFQNRLLPIVAAIAEARDADLVIEIERVLFARRTVDVTNDVIAAFDDLYAERQFDVLPQEVLDQTQTAPSNQTLPEGTVELPELEPDMDMVQEP